MVKSSRFGYMRFDGIASIAIRFRPRIWETDADWGATGPRARRASRSLGCSPSGDAGTPAQSQGTNSFIWQDTVSWTRAAHAEHGRGGEAAPGGGERAILVDGLMQIATFEDFLLGESAAQNGSPQGSATWRPASAARASSAGTSGIRTLPALCRTISGDCAADGECGAALGDLRAAERDRWTTADLRPDDRVSGGPAGGTLSGFEVPDNLPGTLPAGVTRLPDNNMWARRTTRVAAIGLCIPADGQPDAGAARRLWDLLRPAFVGHD